MHKLFAKKMLQKR